jgi:hypothetical protein
MHGRVSKWQRASLASPRVEFESRMSLSCLESRSCRNLYSFYCSRHAVRCTSFCSSLSLFVLRFISSSSSLSSFRLSRNARRCFHLSLSVRSLYASLLLFALLHIFALSLVAFGCRFRIQRKYYCTVLISLHIHILV